jgi:two-component system, NarL family, response regulator
MKLDRNVRVLIADDQSIVREGLTALLSRQRDLKVVAEARDWPGLFTQVIRQRPDITVADLHMPGTPGAAAAIAEILEQSPTAKIVVYSTLFAEEEVLQVIRAGARGYILKSESGTEDLLMCIRAVVKGQVWIHPAVAASLAERITTRSLTKRENNVLQLVVGGKSNKEIASVLSVTEGTVKVHMNHIFGKLGVTSRTAAITKALQRGLARLPEISPFHESPTEGYRPPSSAKRAMPKHT